MNLTESVLRDLDLSSSRAAEILGISSAAVRGKRKRMGLASAPTSPSKKPETTSFAQDKEKIDNGFWQRKHQELTVKYQQALKNTCAVDRLVDVAKDLAPTSYNPAPAIKTKARGKGTPHSAVLLLSDTHVGQVICPDQTLGFGEYNFSTFLARLKFLETAVSSILRDHTTTKVEELVVCFGGDMLHGALVHSVEAGQQNTLFSQFYGAGHAFAQFLRALEPCVPKIRIYCTAGNHPRFSNQHKMPTDNRYSNFDLFLYSYIQALTSNIPTITWNLDKQPRALFWVQKFLFYLSHGDELRGGDRALGIPNHSVGRLISSTNQLFGKNEMNSPHYYLTGHLHKNIVLPHGRGEFIVNGGFPGLDGFGLAAGFSPVDPSQVFFMVHPKYGKVATYNIALKFAEVTDCSPYLIPEGFEVR